MLSCLKESRGFDFTGYKRSSLMRRSTVGLPSERVLPLLRAVLTGGGTPEEVALRAVNRRGREVTVRVMCTPMTRRNGEVSGAILLMDSGGAGRRRAAPGGGQVCRAAGAGTGRWWRLWTRWWSVPGTTAWWRRTC